MNPKKFVHNTAYSVLLPYIAGHSFKHNITELLCKLTIYLKIDVGTFLKKI